MENWRLLKTKNQNQTYFHKTFRAKITAAALLELYRDLGQWQRVAAFYKVSHAYVIMARKWLGIFEKTITRGKQYGGLNSRVTKNGGKKLDKRGYVLVGRYHPENNKGQIIYEHILIAERMLGRSMKPGESVHHIDGNKSNNSQDNLYICDHSLHRKAEFSMIKIVEELYAKGEIGFDRNNGIYFIGRNNENRKEKTQNIMGRKR